MPYVEARPAGEWAEDEWPKSAIATTMETTTTMPTALIHANFFLDFRPCEFGDAGAYFGNGLGGAPTVGVGRGSGDDETTPPFETWSVQRASK
jgi:hypothetical protein